MKIVNIRTEKKYDVYGTRERPSPYINEFIIEFLIYSDESWHWIDSIYYKPEIDYYWERDNR
jgi:hypothetical protein